MPLTAAYLPATPRLLYDGFEDGWLNQPWPLPQADGTIFPARLNCDVHPISEAAAWLGNDLLRQLLRETGATVRDWSGHGNLAYLGANGLQLHYVRHARDLWVLAAGERQPGRYQTFLHGLWQLPPAV